VPLHVPLHEALLEAYDRVLDGLSHVLNKMKRLWHYFSLPFEDCQKTMKEISETRQPDQCLEQVDLFFETEAQSRQPKSNLSALNAFFNRYAGPVFPCGA